MHICRSGCRRHSHHSRFPWGQLDTSTPEARNEGALKIWNLKPSQHPHKFVESWNWKHDLGPETYEESSKLTKGISPFLNRIEMFRHVAEISMLQLYRIIIYWYLLYEFVRSIEVTPTWSFRQVARGFWLGDRMGGFKIVNPTTFR